MNAVIPRLINHGTTGYVNAILHMLFHITPFREEVARITATAAERHGDDIALELHFIFAKMCSFSRTPVSTIGLLRSFGWGERDQFCPHDAHEFQLTLWSALSRRNESGNERIGTMIRDLFEGTIQYTNVSQHTGSSGLRELQVKTCKQRFYSIYAKPGNYNSCDIITAIKESCAPECLCGDVLRTRFSSFTSLPSILQIRLTQQDFDFSEFKIKKHGLHCALPLHVDMAEFVDKAASDGEEKKEGSLELDCKYTLHSVIVHHGPKGTVGTEANIPRYSVLIRVPLEKSESLTRERSTLLVEHALQQMRQDKLRKAFTQWRPLATTKRIWNRLTNKWELPPSLELGEDESHIPPTTSSSSVYQAAKQENWRWFMVQNERVRAVPQEDVLHWKISDEFGEDPVPYIVNYSLDSMVHSPPLPPPTATEFCHVRVKVRRQGTPLDTAKLCKLHLSSLPDVRRAIAETLGVISNENTTVLLRFPNGQVVPVGDDTLGIISEGDHLILCVYSPMQPDDKPVCSICCEKQCRALLEPCGHAMFCETCARRFKECPQCRKRIDRTRKYFP